MKNKNDYLKFKLTNWNVNQKMITSKDEKFTSNKTSKIFSVNGIFLCTSTKKCS